MLKPVDLQVIMPRSVEVQKAQEINQNRTNLEQHNFAHEMNNQLKIRQHQVQEGAATEKQNKIGHDGGSSQKQLANSEKKRSKEEKKSAEPLEEQLDKERGQHIDFKA